MICGAKIGAIPNTLGELSTLARTRMDRGFGPVQGVSTLGEHLRGVEHLSRVSALAPKVLIERLSGCRMDRGLQLRCSPGRRYNNLGAAAANGIKPHIAGSFPAVRTRPRVYQRGIFEPHRLRPHAYTKRGILSAVRARGTHAYTNVRGFRDQYAHASRPRIRVCNISQHFLHPTRPRAPVYIGASPMLQNLTHRTHHARTCAYR